MAQRLLTDPSTSRGTGAFFHKFTVIAASLSLSGPLAAKAEALPADELPQTMLTACDDQAKAVGEFAGPIAAAADDLIAAGIFHREQFIGVRIGFCDLRKANGPVATTSCLDDVILLDAKYKVPSQALARNATLAHEMKHVLQHRENRAAFGAGYCLSDAYEIDKPAMEIEADAFGDDALEILTSQGMYFDR